MSSPYAATRLNIDRRLILGVLRGELDESQAEVWREAFRSLKDHEMAALMRLTRGQSPQKASAITLRFLMEHHYPFREMVLYQTDDGFKRRMMLSDYVDEWNSW
jgi:hypothetical protein